MQKVLLALSALFVILAIGYIVYSQGLISSKSNQPGQDLLVLVRTNEAVLSDPNFDKAMAEQAKMEKSSIVTLQANCQATPSLLQVKKSTGYFIRNDASVGQFIKITGSTPSSEPRDWVPVGSKSAISIFNPAEEAGNYALYCGQKGIVGVIRVQ